MKKNSGEFEIRSVNFIIKTGVNTKDRKVFGFYIKTLLRK